MRYIKSIRIRGFQSHDDTTLQLHPGLNAITGPSDNGKSAILRALTWWAWNITPDGDWQRKGATLTQVEVLLSDGTAITRERRHGRNRYLIVLPGQPLMELADFGRNVPMEVLQAHGMVPVKFDPNTSTMLNLASQLEPPFFLTESAPQRARMLGRLAGVHVIDHGIRTANAEIQAANREATRQQAEVDRLGLQLEGYADLEAQEARVARAEELLATLGPLDQRIEQLGTAATRFSHQQAGMAATNAILQGLQGVEAAAERLRTAQEAETRAQRLQNLFRQSRATQEALEQVQAVLVRHTRLPEAEAAVLRAGMAVSRLQDLALVLFDHRRLEGARKETAAILERTRHVQAAAVALAGAAGATGTLERLTAVSDRYRYAEAEAEDAARAVSLAVRRLASSEPLARAGALQERLSTLTARRVMLQDTDQRLAKGQGVIANLNASLDYLGGLYANALQDSGICPTCLQTIDPRTAARIAVAVIKKEECVHAD